MLAPAVIHPIFVHVVITPIQDYLLPCAGIQVDLGSTIPARPGWHPCLHHRLYLFFPFHLPPIVARLDAVLSGIYTFSKGLIDLHGSPSITLTSYTEIHWPAMTHPTCR